MKGEKEVGICNINLKEINFLYFLYSYKIKISIYIKFKLKYKINYI